MKKLQYILEFGLFGVCAKLGRKMGLAGSSVRLFFIYISFLALGSPIFVYMALAWIIDFRKHLRLKRNLLRDF
ncbi:MAG: PspC family transcriptional regulator [Bacteroidetes bacterium]|nr:MAG: PspC family transcriptional regulator [Bacteroidota bacterium]